MLRLRVLELERELVLPPRLIDDLEEGRVDELVAPFGLVGLAT